MAFSNVYRMNVDIKRRLTSVVPTFKQGDNGVLRFKIYDDGRLFDLSDYTYSEITFRLPNGEPLVGNPELVNGELVYNFTRAEMAVVGKVETVLSIMSGNDMVSLQPFTCFIFDSMKNENLSYVGILQDLIKETQNQGLSIEGVLLQLQDTLDWTDESVFELRQIINETEDSENVRTQNETLRINTESTRIDNEDIRLTNEQLRIQNENLRQQEYDLFKGWTAATEWNANTTYSKNNVVTRNFSTYQSKVDNNIGNPPNGTDANWLVLARKGVDGQGAVSTVNGKSPELSGDLEIVAQDITYKNNKNMLQALDETNQQLAHITTDVKTLGASGNGVGDDYVYLQELFSLPVDNVLVPDGVYITTQKLVITDTKRVHLSENAIIKAMSPMDNVIEVNTNTRGGGIFGGAIDANNVARDGVFVQMVRGYYLDTKVLNEIRYGFRLGDDALDNSYEIVMNGARKHRSGLASGGSYGVFLENCTDSHFSDVIAVGSENAFGISEKSASNIFVQCHGWNSTTHGAMKKAFEVKSKSNVFVGCYSDTAHEFGWDFYNEGNVLQGCIAFNGATSGGLDNLSVAFNNRANYKNVFSGCVVNAIPSLRFARTFGGSTVGLTVTGLVETNVVVPYSQNKMFNPLLLENFNDRISISPNGQLSTNRNVAITVRKGESIENGYIVDATRFSTTIPNTVDLGTSALPFKKLYISSIRLDTGQVDVFSGEGSPEGVVNGNKASLYLRTNGGANTTFYVKETSWGNTGWVAK